MEHLLNSHSACWCLKPWAALRPNLRHYWSCIDPWVNLFPLCHTAVYTILVQQSDFRYSHTRVADLTRAFLYICKIMLYRPWTHSVLFWYFLLDFAEKLLKQLESSKERFEVKMMLMNLISRLVGIHEVWITLFLLVDIGNRIIFAKRKPLR